MHMNLETLPKFGLFTHLTTNCLCLESLRSAAAAGSIEVDPICYRLILIPTSLYCLSADHIKILWQKAHNQYVLSEGFVATYTLNTMLLRTKVVNKIVGL